MLVRGKRFSILGAGRSGLAVARLLKTRRAKVFLSEAAKKSKYEDAVREMDEIGVEYEFGDNTHLVLEADYVVLSPGVPLDAPIVKLAREKNIKIVSEVEVAFDQCEAPVVAITGTNGKTTITFLVESIFRAAGRRSMLVGTIEYHAGGKVLPAPHTTPESLELNRLFSQALQDGATFARTPKASA